MENYNDIPSTGTIGGMVTNINANFQLTKEMLERLEITKDKSVGLFSTLASLQATYPSPEVGDWALVGDSTPFAVYKCTTAGTWSDTGGTYDGGSIDLSDYVTKEEFDGLDAKISTDGAYTSISGLLVNRGWVRYSDGNIVPGTDTTYVASRYSNPIAVNKGDMIYINASIRAATCAVITLCDSEGGSRVPVVQGIAGTANQEYRYYVEADGYIIISTYSFYNLAKEKWLKHSSILGAKIADVKTSVTQLGARVSTAESNITTLQSNVASLAVAKNYGNTGIWVSNPDGNAARLDTNSGYGKCTRREIYNSIRGVVFEGDWDKSIKRTLGLYWNGSTAATPYFRFGINEYVNGAWARTFDTGNKPIADYNPTYNGTILVTFSSGTKKIKIVVDTSILGENHTGTLINNPATALEPELIFSELCYQDAATTPTPTASLANVPPTIYPNAQLPCISFEFDDCGANDADVVALFDEFGLTCNFAFIASDANIANVGQDYLAWNQRGYGICSHSVDGKAFDTTNYTRATALAALQTSKSKLEAIGIKVGGFVSPNSTMADDFLDLVELTYGYAFTKSDGYAGKRNGNPCRQGRISMEASAIDYLKGRIGVARDYDYIYTFYGHTNNFGTTHQSGGLWNLAKLRSLLEYAVERRDAGEIYIGNTDDCMNYYYKRPYNRNLSGAIGNLLPKANFTYYLREVTSANIQYNANKLADCEIYIETAASGFSGITFGSGYKFNSTPNFAASQTWYLRIINGCVIATQLT